METSWERPKAPCWESL